MYLLILIDVLLYTRTTILANYQCKICWNKALTFGVGSIQLSFRIYHCVHPIHANMFSIQMLLHFSQIVRRVCPLVLSFCLRCLSVCVFSLFWHLAQSGVQTAVSATSAILGGPMSDWSWLKASLPSSHGGFNLRSAHLHARVIYISSSSSSKQLVESMLGLPPTSSSHVCSTVAALRLAVAVAKPE